MIPQQTGDNPDCPYVTATARTAFALCSVQGQTLHSAFGFNFGSKHYSLGDKKCDELRTLMANLRLLILDELSMVKADVLYQIDLWLREIMQKQNQLFGGISIFLLGDILQLHPIEGSYIFDAPIYKDHMLAHLCKTYWDSFDVMLEGNCIQGENRGYAELLNRIRKGMHTSDDIAVLKTKVWPEGHLDMIGAMDISCTIKTVNQMNDMHLNELNTEFYEIEAINTHQCIKIFQPKVNEKGIVGWTSILQILKIKASARVMLVYIIHALDGLANGSTGEPANVIKDSKGNIKILMIRFHKESHGA